MVERTMSVEDKIKRAEEIYNKRREGKNRTTTVNVSSKKDFKLLKKMIIQIIVCLTIYSIFYLVKNNNYIFSEDLINKTKEILSYDVNFGQIYNNAVQSLNSMKSDNTQNVEAENQTTEQQTENGIGGAEEQVEENQATEQTQELTQMEQDVQDIKNSISFIKPIEGTITSTFGWRNPTTSTVPKYHTGLDIANVSGTVICSATDGADRLR